MIHARPDYQRFQEPKELVEIIRELISDLDEGTETSTERRDEIEELIKDIPTTVSPIADLEPVILFRAQDVAFVPILHAYKAVVTGMKGEDDPIIDQLDAHIELAEKWQANNFTKVPDTVTEED